ncbi:MAG TPA: threonine/serine exporter family protein, partial [Campylobacterales bacterium]|nr:threonine/serine exporter family protein [Campylobacterales bacterium]
MTRIVEIADAALWIGKEMMESGADSSSVEEAMLSFLCAKGFENVGILVLPKSVLVTLSYQGGFHTKMKHIDDVTPNFERLSLI